MRLDVHQDSGPKPAGWCWHIWSQRSFAMRKVLFPDDQQFWYETLRSGRRVSARDGLLRASSYYRSADFFLHNHPDDTRHHHAYDRSVETFQTAAPLFTTPAQFIPLVIASLQTHGKARS
jgi:hypothetical protein